MLKPFSENISKLALVSIVLGLFFSNALKSIGLVYLAASFLIHPDSLKNIKVLLKDSLFVSCLIIASLYLLSFLYGGDLFYFFFSSRNKILYFFVPLALVNTPLNKSEFRFLFYLFICSALIQTLYATSYFFINDNSKALYSIGQVLPTIKINHVEISWLLSISVLLIINAISISKDNTERLFLIIVGCWIFLFIHLFAVRTGIVLLYVFLMIHLGCLLYKNQKKYIPIIPFLVSLCLFISYTLSENLRQKVNYTLYDISQLSNDKENFQSYSDSRRILSFKVGIDIIKENPFLGCGIGNMKDFCRQIYERKYPFIKKLNYYRPHSFYIYAFAGFGLIFGSILLLSFFYPLLYFFKNNNVLFFNLYFSIVVISLWDVIVGTLFGECIYILIIGWGIKINKGEHTSYQ